MPIPDTYNDLFSELSGQSILGDVKSGKRNIADSAFHRLIFTNSPKKTSRNRKRDTRTR